MARAGVLGPHDLPYPSEGGSPEDAEKAYEEASQGGCQMGESPRALGPAEAPARVSYVHCKSRGLLDLVHQAAGEVTDRRVRSWCVRGLVGSSRLSIPSPAGCTRRPAAHRRFLMV